MRALALALSRTCTIRVLATLFFLAAMAAWLQVLRLEWRILRAQAIALAIAITLGALVIASQARKGGSREGCPLDCMLLTAMIFSAGCSILLLFIATIITQGPFFHYSIAFGGVFLSSRGIHKLFFGESQA